MDFQADPAAKQVAKVPDELQLHQVAPSEQTQSEQAQQKPRGEGDLTIMCSVLISNIGSPVHHPTNEMISIISNNPVDLTISATCVGNLLPRKMP